MNVLKAIVMLEFGMLASCETQNWCFAIMFGCFALAAIMNCKDEFELSEADIKLLRCIFKRKTKVPALAC